MPPLWVMAGGCTSRYHYENNPSLAEEHALIRAYWDAIDEQIRAEDSAAKLKARLDKLRAVAADLQS